MSKKLQSLQQALSATVAKAARPVEETQPMSPATVQAGPPPATTRPGRSPSRVGQVNISAWMDPAYKSSLRLIQAQKGHKCELQDLITEALNDLFAKYHVPTVRQG